MYVQTRKGQNEEPLESSPFLRLSEVSLSVQPRVPAVVQLPPHQHRCARASECHVRDDARLPALVPPPDGFATQLNAACTAQPASCPSALAARDAAFPPAAAPGALLREKLFPCARLSFWGSRVWPTHVAVTKQTEHLEDIFSNLPRHSSAPWQCHT